MSCGVGHRRDTDPELLWFWCRPAAIAPIRSLAWEPPYAAGVALKKKKKRKKKKMLWAIPSVISGRQYRPALVTPLERRRKPLSTSSPHLGVWLWVLARGGHSFLGMSTLLCALVKLPVPGKALRQRSRAWP